MAIEDSFMQATKAGSFEFHNCQFVFGGHAQMGEFLQNLKSASTQNQEHDIDPKLKSEKAKEMWRLLVEHNYCHVEGSVFVWDATQVEYGYMVFIVSDILGCKHPSSGNLLWKDFKVLFPHDDSFENGAHVAVSKNLSGMTNHKSWPNSAKIIRNILMR